MSSNRCCAILGTIPFCILVIGGAASAAGLESIVVIPQNGQTEDKARRDRYECHNWAIAQTGTVPGSPPAKAAADESRAERVDRVITGASIGAAVGGLIRGSQNENPSQGMLTGGAIGAAVGAFSGRKSNDDDEDPEFDAYFRALGACLEARDYAVERADER